MNYRIITTNELYHHGIKGQKWGVRRFQNSDGSLKSAGKKRYSEDKPKEKKAIKVGVLIGFSAIIAGGAYYAKKYYNMNADVLIKKGKEIQHMGRVRENLNEPFYASYLKRDNKVYAKNDFFGSHWKTQKTLVSNKNLKVAGTKTTLKAFKEWVENNPEAKEKFKGLDTNDKNKLKSAYFVFNKNMNSPDIYDKKLFKSFYSELSKKGYSAIRDKNDQFQSGTISPIILFDSLSELMTMKVKDLK